MWPSHVTTPVLQFCSMINYHSTDIIDLPSCLTSPWLNITSQYYTIRMLWPSSRSNTSRSRNSGLPWRWQVRGTSRTLQPTGLLWVTRIFPGKRIITRNTACWTQRVWLSGVSFSFDPFYLGWQSSSHLSSKK